MTVSSISQTITLLGCGKMGGALLSGWLTAGLSPNLVTIIEPNADGVTEFKAKGCRIVSKLDELTGTDAPDCLMIALKPQIIPDILPIAQHLISPTTMLISIAAGLEISRFKELSTSAQPVVRIMPNTPASVGEGMAAAFASTEVSANQIDMVDGLLKAGGASIWLDDEHLMHAVTAISGSGPAYIFHMIEALEAAGAKLGLPADQARILAIQTVKGAGVLASSSDQPPATLRKNVTSPKGTTAAGLEVLMATGDEGLIELIHQTATAAWQRSKELG